MYQVGGLHFGEFCLKFQDALLAGGVRGGCSMIECVGPRPSPSVGLLPSVGGRCPGFEISKLQVGQDQCCGTEVG